MGYWDVALKRLFPKASEFKEDWDAKKVSCEFRNPTGPLSLVFGVEVIAAIKAAFGEVSTMTLDIKPDTSYAGDREYDDGKCAGVIVTVTISDVVFPERPS